MKRVILVLAVFCIVLKGFSQQKESTGVISRVVTNYNDTSVMHFMDNSQLYNQGWDLLANTKLWKEVMCLSSDSCILNVASCRQEILRVDRSNWMTLSEESKTNFKDSVRNTYCINNDADIFVTSGKEEFYDIRKMVPEISKAIDVFKASNCDPWYAQSILLIESPGRAKAKSSVGAKGPFQLMKAVARKYGLKVNKYGDDRTNLEKSARAAAKLLNNACIPYIKSYLDGYHLAYNENDLWFRLLVLHAYHAGAGNVKCVLDAINPKEGGIALFQKIWTTTCGRFKNESQNYSQIALASIMRFNDIINQDGDTVFMVQGDRDWKKYKGNKGNQEYLSNCLVSYENDLVDGTIPYDYFNKRVTAIKKELAAINKNSKQGIAFGTYPASETHIDSLASRLLRKQRYDEAITLLKMNLDMHPRSPATYDSLATAYTLAGKPKLASIYSNKSVALDKMENKNE